MHRHAPTVLALSLFAPAANANLAVMDFESRTLDEMFGPAFGQNQGDLLFTEGGIRAVVGNTTFDANSSPRAWINNRHDGDGGILGQCLFTGGLAVSYDFSQLGFAVSRVEMDYFDTSDDKYLAIGGEVVHFDDFAHDIDDLPATLGGISITVTGDGDIGTILFEGAITAIEFGGDELCLDNITATPAPAGLPVLLGGVAPLLAPRRRQTPR